MYPAKILPSCIGFIPKLALCATLLAAASPVRAGTPAAYHFDFGAGPAPPGCLPVTPTNFYSDAVGYGFEPGAAVRSVPGGGVIADRPLYFSVRLPEGNYRVTVMLGGRAGASSTAVKAELRRLMLEEVHTAPGRPVTRSFIVNVRTPRIAGDGEVQLKPREKSAEAWAWDDRLTLEFNGEHPCIDTLNIERADVPTVFILGDSTVCDQPAAPWNSWGQMLPRFFKPEIAVANHSESGETLAGSLAARRFEKVFSLMQPGDWLLLQFGHNDMKDRKPDALETYRENLGWVIARTRARGGTPVLITSMERKAGVAHPTLGGYPAAAREVARQQKCALIDLNAMSLVLYRALGTNLDKAFVDGTHHDNYGSYELAQCVVEAIRQHHLPLAKYIVEDFKGFDPAYPDPPDAIRIPVSPRISGVAPLGDGSGRSVAEP